MNGLEECGFVGEDRIISSPVIFRRSFPRCRLPKARRLFSPPGAQIDALGWVEVTPENFALEIAERVRRWIGKDNQILDVCAGLGGNTAAFARRGLKVLAVEIDDSRVKKAMHNCRKLYGLKVDRINGEDSTDLSLDIQFICADFLTLQIPETWNFLCAFISPPWGGAESNRKPFRLRPEPGNCSAPSFAAQLTIDLVVKASRITDRLVMYLPCSTTVEDAIWLAQKVGMAELTIEVLMVEDEPKVCVLYLSRNRKAPTAMPALLYGTTAGQIARRMFHGIFQRASDEAAKAFSVHP